MMIILLYTSMDTGCYENNNNHIIPFRVSTSFMLKSALDARGHEESGRTSIHWRLSAARRLDHRSDVKTLDLLLNNEIRKFDNHIEYFRIARNIFIYTCLDAVLSFVQNSPEIITIPNENDTIQSTTFAPNICFSSASAFNIFGFTHK